MTAGALGTSSHLFRFQFNMAKAEELRGMGPHRKMGLGVGSFGSYGFLPLSSLMILGKSINVIAYIFTNSGLCIGFFVVGFF